MTGIKKLFECLWRIGFLNKQRDLQSSSAAYQKFRRQRVWWSRARCFMCLCFLTLALKVRQWDNYVVDTKGAQKMQTFISSAFLYTHIFSFLINKKKSIMFFFFKQAYAAGVECIIMASEVGQQFHFKNKSPNSCSNI